jgi:hypothetical protein
LAKTAFRRDLLHVIWAWARGLVQYRDVFDNHMPLFQILFAPIFALVGERATALFWMWFLLLPMFFIGAVFVLSWNSQFHIAMGASRRSPFHAFCESSFAATLPFKQIVPVIDALFTSKLSLLLIAPHPDDHALACASN